MKDIELFQLALGISSPWFVKSLELDPAAKRLDIHLDFQKGSKFTCPECGAEGRKVHDTVAKTWRHLNFFQYEAYLTARVPRVHCDACGVHMVPVPWAREGSGFTLLFEALVLSLAPAMPIKTLAKELNMHDTRLWRVVRHYTEQALERRDLSRVRNVGFDETSSKRGHDYVSVFVDLDTSKVIFATEGKDSSTLGRFKTFLEEHGGRGENIERMCCDMSQAFIKGAREHFPGAKLTFDKFHVMKAVNDAVDSVRREERKEDPSLAHTRYLWLKNPQSLTEKQKERLGELSLRKHNRKTARAYQMKLSFQEIFKRFRLREEGELLLKKWYFWATHSRLSAMVGAARTIKHHWDGVLQWFESHINNGILEGINSLIQACKARARGYRSKENLISMIYLIAGKLQIGLPT